VSGDEGVGGDVNASNILRVRSEDEVIMKSKKTAIFAVKQDFILAS